MISPTESLTVQTLSESRKWIMGLHKIIFFQRWSGYYILFADAVFKLLQSNVSDDIS